MVIKKNPENKYQLIIDEDEAVNIRLMVKKYISGDGLIKICKYLNNNKILCRKEVQRRIKWGISLESDADEIRYKWSKSTIGKILTDETYIGNLVQNRTTSVSYKNHKVVYRPREEWIVVKNTHEPIISNEDYEKVQEILKLRNYERKPSSNLSIYYGKIKCVTIELNHLVLQTILMQVRLVLDLEKAINKLKNNGKDKEIESNYNTNMEMLERNIDKYKRLKKKSYEDWKLNNITKEEYEMYSIDYDKKIANYTNEIKVV